LTSKSIPAPATRSDLKSSPKGSLIRLIMALVGILSTLEAGQAH
jgi:hypothetical protein